MTDTAIKTRSSTVAKYIEVTGILRTLTRTPAAITPAEFAKKHEVTGNYIPAMVRAGLVKRLSRGMYQWVGPMPQYQTMQQIIQDYINPRYRKKAGIGDVLYTPGKPKQGTLDFSKPAANDEDRIAKLESRVASLEQLIIRRGIA